MNKPDAPWLRTSKAAGYSERESLKALAWLI